jgi:hypothetical protein
MGVSLAVDFELEDGGDGVEPALQWEWASGYEGTTVHSNSQLTLADHFVIERRIFRIERRILRGYTRGAIQGAFLVPRGAFFGFHSLRLETLDFFLSLLKS